MGSRVIVSHWCADNCIIVHTVEPPTDGGIFGLVECGRGLTPTVAHVVPGPRTRSRSGVERDGRGTERVTTTLRG